MIDDLRERISILVENLEPEEAQREYDKRVKIIERILDEQPKRDNQIDRGVAVRRNYRMSVRGRSTTG